MYRSAGGLGRFSERVSLGFSPAAEGSAVGWRARRTGFAGGSEQVVVQFGKIARPLVGWWDKKRPCSASISPGFVQRLGSFTRAKIACPALLPPRAN